jgi:hypothetical protein
LGGTYFDFLDFSFLDGSGLVLTLAELLAYGGGLCVETWVDSVGRCKPSAELQTG